MARIPTQDGNGAHDVVQILTPIEGYVLWGGVHDWPTLRPGGDPLPREAAQPVRYELYPAHLR